MQFSVLPLILFTASIHHALWIQTALSNEIVDLLYSIWLSIL